MFVEAVLLTAPVIGGFASAIHTRNDTKTWYQTIYRPWFTPPNWVFPPVWTSLYLGMGYASLIIYQKGGFQSNHAAWGYYAGQLLLNLSWSTCPASTCRTVCVGVFAHRHVGRLLFRPSYSLAIPCNMYKLRSVEIKPDEA
eukprot:gene7313-9722_t